MKNKIKTLVKKLNTKVDKITDDSALAEQLKTEIEELAGMTVSGDFNDQLDIINSKLDSLETNNTSLKEYVSDFVASTTKTLENFAKTENSDEKENAVELNKFLKTLEGKIDKLAKKTQDDLGISDIYNEENSFKKLKSELTFFQNELEKRINDNFTGINEALLSVTSGLRQKITELQDNYEQNSEKLLTEIINDIKQLKTDVSELFNNVQSIDNQAIFETEKNVKKLIEQSKDNKKQLLAEIQEVKAETVKNEFLDEKAKKAVETFKNEIAQLKSNIHAQIREVLSKMVLQDEIKFLCEEAITGIKNNNTETNVLRKYLKDIKADNGLHEEHLNELKNIILELSDFEMTESSDKIDIIYENMSMLNNWANSSDEMLKKFDGLNNSFDNLGGYFDDLRDDFGLNADKIDIIYENLTFINEWVKKLDEFSQKVELIKASYDSETEIPEKIEEISKNIAFVKEWNKKADALALQVRALSVQISETESTINSQNLSEMKKMFAQLTEDMSNLSSRTNKMILESDKANDTMKDHIVNLRSIINNLDTKSSSLGLEELKNKLDDIKRLNTKSSGFEQGLTESFMYLAEWIDYAGNAINGIKADVENLKNSQISNNNTANNEELLINIQAIINNAINQRLTHEETEEVKTEEEIPQNSILPEIQQVIEKQNEQILQLKEQNDFAMQQLAAQIALNQQMLQDIKENQQNLAVPTPEDNENTDNSAILEGLQQLAELIEKEKQDNQTKINEVLQDTTAALQQKSENSEIKKLLDFIAAQVVNMNENSSKTDLLNKKIESVEAKISNLEQYMARLIDYLDED